MRNFQGIIGENKNWYIKFEEGGGCVGIVVNRPSQIKEEELERRIRRALREAGCIKKVTLIDGPGFWRQIPKMGLGVGKTGMFTIFERDFHDKKDIDT